jgi:hypothetical protein
LLDGPRERRLELSQSVELVFFRRRHRRSADVYVSLTRLRRYARVPGPRLSHSTEPRVIDVVNTSDCLAIGLPGGRSLWGMTRGRTSAANLTRSSRYCSRALVSGSITMCVTLACGNAGSLRRSRPGHPREGSCSASPRRKSRFLGRGDRSGNCGFPPLRGKQGSGSPLGSGCCASIGGSQQRAMSSPGELITEVAFRPRVEGVWTDDRIARGSGAGSWR